jgi:hypothetical protein
MFKTYILRLRDEQTPWRLLASIARVSERHGPTTVIERQLDPACARAIVAWISDLHRGGLTRIKLPLGPGETSSDGCRSGLWSEQHYRMFAFFGTKSQKLQPANATNG